MGQLASGVVGICEEIRDPGPHYVDHSTLEAFLARLGAAFAQPGRLYLVGETSHVFEGWRERTERLEFAAEVVPDDRAAFNPTSLNCVSSA